jgi:hypothetical protein
VDQARIVFEVKGGFGATCGLVKVSNFAKA